jgi:diguanylate cyclase (GGDEF)-like protein
MKFVDVSSAVYDESGNAIGVLAAHLSWTWADEIQSSLFASASARKNLDFFVISHSDNMILLGPDALIGQTLALDSIENARSGKNNWSIERWPDGNEYLTGYVLADGYKDYSGLAWVVLVRQPVDTAFASAEYMQYYTLILGVLLTLFFAGLGWWIAGQITESLTEITKAAKALGKGERIEIPKDKGILEIEQLSQSLDEMVYNLTHAESALSEMQSLAHHDALTGLPNRIALDMYLHNTKTRARLHGMDIAVLYLDLDGFKAVNDAWGHHYGDEVLKAIAGRLTANTRTDELVARLGGDEFVMVLYAPEEKARRVASVVAGRVIDAINRPISIQGNEMHVGCSVGIAIWTQIEDDSKTVQNNADTALYYSKRTGKNKMTFFEDIEVK